jgi:hypothetical protein
VFEQGWFRGGGPIGASPMLMIFAIVSGVSMDSFMWSRSWDHSGLRRLGGWR